MRAASALAVAMSLALEAQPVISKNVAAPPTAPTVHPEPKALEPSLPVPSDIAVELGPAPIGFRLTLRRAGYIVALRAAEGVSVAENWVSAQLEMRDGAGVDLEWETTEPLSLDSDRGELRVRRGREGPVATLTGLARPVVVTTRQERLHTCRGHAAWRDGFAVLCRVSKSARKVSVSNPTDEQLLSNVWMSSGLARVIRLDLPLSEGEAAGRVLGYLAGADAVVVRAEASWAKGEEHPSMALFETERRQPVVTWGGVVF
jgi:hypothetical protein